MFIRIFLFYLHILSSYCVVMGCLKLSSFFWSAIEQYKTRLQFCVKYLSSVIRIQRDAIIHVLSYTCYYTRSIITCYHTHAIIHVLSYTCYHTRATIHVLSYTCYYTRSIITCYHTYAIIHVLSYTCYHTRAIIHVLSYTCYHTRAIIHVLS